MVKGRWLPAFSSGKTEGIENVGLWNGLLDSVMDETHNGLLLKRGTGSLKRGICLLPKVQSLDSYYSFQTSISTTLNLREVLEHKILTDHCLLKTVHCKKQIAALRSQ